MGTSEVYVPCHPALFRQVLKSAHIYDKGGPFYERGREAVGNGLATCRWADHRHQRPLMQPSFDHRHISYYAELMTDEVDALMRTWQSGQVIDVDKAMMGLALRITTRALFSVPADHRLVAQVGEWLPVLMAGAYWRMVLPSHMVSLIPTKINRQYPRAVGEMRKATEEFIAEVRNSGEEDLGILSALLNARDDRTGAPLRNQEIFDQVLILLIGGTETAATALGFSFHLLGGHAEAAAKLRSEVDSQLAGRTPRLEDLANLTFTKQVIMESLRLYPPVWMSTRVVTEATELGGYKFDKGTTFLISPYILHHNPDLFHQPESFNPDRWQPGGMSDESRRSVLPFGAGARKCIGDQFGLTEMTIALAGIAARWDLNPVSDRPLQPIARATLKPGRLPMRLQERRHEPVQAGTTANYRD